jgi:uncharacterized membrane protein
VHPRPASVVFLLSALSGFFFTAWSTSDFVQHLDRQVHAIHCSFVPGLAAADVSGTSGCHVALMSPYSSWFRSLVWGGIPATLAGMAVFAFLAWKGFEVLRDGGDRERARFLLAASLLPTLTSIAYGYLALVELDAVCKLCIGIYASSAGCLFAAIAMVVQTTAPGAVQLPALLVRGISQGVAFVAAPVALYLLLAPDFSSFVGACGTLESPEDPQGVLVELGGNQSGPVTVEVFDPLCPACAGFEDRLSASGLAEQLHRKALLFPLDDECNWMVTSAIHPGACFVSQAVICSSADPWPVIQWSFEHQQEIRDTFAADKAAGEKMVRDAFPAIADCVGSHKTQQALNRSLRWAVKNQLPVLTPQLYVNGTKLCDEDTDLGLDWALTRLVAKESP